MSANLRCSACGKSLWATDEEAGHVVVCPACGATARVPTLTERPLEPLVPRAPRGNQVAAPPRAAMGRTLPHVPGNVWGEAEQPRQRNHATLSRWWILTGVVVLLVCMAAAAAVYLRAPKADANGRQLLAIKGEAEELGRSGRLIEAHAKYQQFAAEAASRPINDPSLRMEIEQARADQDALYEKLTQRGRRHVEEAGGEMPVVSSGTFAQNGPAVEIKTSSAVAAESAAASAEPAKTQVPRANEQEPQGSSETPRGSAPTSRLQHEAQEVVSKEERAPVRARMIDRPPVRPISIPSMGISDEEIGKAIEKGADFLLSQFENSQLKFINGRSGPYEAGLDVLCTYALLQCGQAINDERLNIRAKLMKGILDRMRELPMSGTCETYNRGLRATALAVYNRVEDRTTLKSDVAWLINATKNGGYTYTDANRQKPEFWDNSNSQYGLLGVWSGAEVGAEVPLKYWQTVQNHWYETQYDNGEWGYMQARHDGGRLSMTCAGLASLFVAHDYLDAITFGAKVGRDPFSKNLARGLAWLEKGDNCLDVKTGWGAYTLYSLERVGLASGFKYFGAHDWYRELAREVVAEQAADGSWSRDGAPRGFRGRRFRNGDLTPDDLVETSYSLLFLARGRHPILMNKLRFDGHWANRPRDVANLARFASNELERPLNWQVVSLDRDWTDWTDAPILYLASHEAPKLKENDYVKLRRFVEAGGLLFTQADGGSEVFNKFVVELSKKLFPTFEWADLPKDHDIYTINFHVDPRPKLRFISNGSRILMLHAPEDISQHWQLRADKSKRNVFELGVNLFIYAAGKTDLRNRLAGHELPVPSGERGFSLRVARVKYGGLWDPEPGAFTRFANWFEYQTGYGLIVSTVEANQLDVKTHPVAHLTGTAPWTASDGEVEALRKYVESGGTLIIDACGGAWQFGQSVSGNLLRRGFDKAQSVAMDELHPLLSGKGDGMERLSRPMLRPFAEKKLGKSAAPIELYSLGRGHVIYSALDLTSGLLNTNTWSLLGYRPSYAQSFMKNAILWTVDGAGDK